MEKYVVFEYNKDTFQYTARFYKNGEQFEWKRLTEIEESNLEEFLEELEDKVSLDDLFEARDAGVWQDSEDGDTTNFELMLLDLAKA
jgi:hypothetical protein